MKLHHFVTANSCAWKLVYRMLFIDGDEREVPLPQPSLFSLCRRPWSCSKEELDEQLRLLGFHIQQGIENQEEEEAPPDHHTVYHTGAPSSSYQDEGASSSYFGDATSWPSWDWSPLRTKAWAWGEVRRQLTHLYIIFLWYFVYPYFIFFLFFVVLVLISTFQNTKRPKIFPSFLFVCLFSFLALVCFVSYFWFGIWKIQKDFALFAISFCSYFKIRKPKNICCSFLVL
jgi:hypothetical protein